MNELNKKYEALQERIRSLGKVAVAFSAGVDSSLLLRVAHDCLGDNVLALTANSCIFPRREMEEAVFVCEHYGIQHVVCQINALAVPGFKANASNRCYICKKNIFGRFLETAAGYDIPYVLEGSNADDVDDFRPGMKAIRELDIISPLKEVGLTKDEIRHLSKMLNLASFDKASFACLASRIPYGDMITEKKLNMVDQAEMILYECGFQQYRVRHHGRIARIEIWRDEFEHMMDSKILDRVTMEFNALGFDYVTLDLKGYRTGSMNEILDLHREQKE